MSEPEIILVEEHYPITINRGLSNYMEFSRQSRDDDASNTHTWAKLWNHIDAWAKQHGHPTVAGNFPVFLKRSYHHTHEADVCDEGDTEIARVSESYARAIDDMRGTNIVLNADGTVLYLPHPGYLPLSGLTIEVGNAWAARRARWEAAFPELAKQPEALVNPAAWAALATARAE